MALCRRPIIARGVRVACVETDTEPLSLGRAIEELRDFSANQERRVARQFPTFRSAHSIAAAYQSGAVG